MIDCKHEASKLRLGNVKTTSKNNDQQVTITITLRCLCGEEIYFGNSFELESTKQVVYKK